MLNRREGEGWVEKKSAGWQGLTVFGDFLIVSPAWLKQLFVFFVPLT